MRVLGIDCGGEYTGYGIVDHDANGHLTCVFCGAVRLNARRPLPERLSQIIHELRVVMAARSRIGSLCGRPLT